MERKTFEECFDWLEKFHGKRGAITPEYRETFFGAFATEADDIFCESVSISNAKLPPGMFPTIERMRQFVTDAREQIWQRQKDTEPKKPLSQPVVRGDYRNKERALQWFAGIREILEGKITADQLIARMGRPAPRPESPDRDPR